MQELIHQIKNLNTKRLRSSTNEEIEPFESDRGRIINSAAIRRLQQKTQVFPLERNSVVRTRLTHSMEVQQVGRYIVQTLFKKLNEEEAIDFKLQHSIESVVEMACLAHDVGNPPFGHFGEAAINHWFIEFLDPEKIPLLKNAKNITLVDSMIEDLTHFEGNAQGIRLVHSLLELNLTYSQIGAILKYTRCASEKKENSPKEYDYLTKKPGFYLSEQSFIKKIDEELNLKPYCRYFLSYIMEAADDISYCIADLEDAVEKNILTIDQLYELLNASWMEDNKDQCRRLFEKVIQQSYHQYLQEKQDKLAFAERNFFAELRENTINHLVPYAVTRILENQKNIADGSFNQALLEKGKSPEFHLLNCFKTVARNNIFNHSSIESTMLQGFKVITGLLDFYAPLYQMSADDFIQLIGYQVSDSETFMVEKLLVNRLSSKYCKIYLDTIATLDKHDDDYLLWEFYYRVRLIQDYVSGMTDHFAYDEYRSLMAIA